MFNKKTELCGDAAGPSIINNKILLHLFYHNKAFGWWIQVKLSLNSPRTDGDKNKAAADLALFISILAQKACLV